MKRILIIINKGWEADAALSAIFNDDIRYPTLDYKTTGGVFTLGWLDFPRSLTQGAGKPRAVFATANYQYEVWCIQNIMTPQPAGNTDPLYYSNSLQKSLDFPKILEFSTTPITLVVAFGTAGTPTEVTKNGGLVIGSNAFVFDVPHSPPVVPRYQRAQFGQLLTSAVNPGLFNQMNIALSTMTMHKFFEGKALLPPINPAGNFWLVADASIVAISDVNITNYGDFATADPAALAAYATANPTTNAPIAYSVETTHGIIRLESGVNNFMFLSAITDRDAYFNSEVVPRASAQNFSCAFNGGIFLTWFLPFLEANAALVG